MVDLLCKSSLLHRDCGAFLGFPLAELNFEVDVLFQENAKIYLISNYFVI